MKNKKLMNKIEFNKKKKDKKNYKRNQNKRK